MSTLRKLEREVIRNQCRKENGNTKNFKKAWDDYHYKRTEEVDENGNVTSTRKRRTSKKKQKHNDNGKVFIKQLKAWKSFINNMKDKANSKKLENDKEN